MCAFSRLARVLGWRCVWGLARVLGWRCVRGSGAPPARRCTGVGSLPSTCLSGGLVPSTIPEAMRDAARQFADSVAIAEPDGVSSRAGGAPEKLTYQQLHQAVRQVAGGLAVRGIEPGD